jgi:hypothetical protein
MKHVKQQTMLALVVLLCLSAVGCLDTNDVNPAASVLTEAKEETQARVVLDDGVYPVVLTGETVPRGDNEIQIVELEDVPLEGSVDSSPDRIRVIACPLLRFRNLSYFDFTFEEGECTEVGFENSDELRAYTRDHVGSRLAVVIDNKVITHHKIREAIEADQVRITFCTVGCGDLLHEHLKELKLAADSNRKSFQPSLDRN